MTEHLPDCVPPFMVGFGAVASCGGVFFSAYR
jgi:hypothetical protein